MRQILFLVKSLKQYKMSNNLHFNKKHMTTFIISAIDWFNPKGLLIR